MVPVLPGARVRQRGRAWARVAAVAAGVSIALACRAPAPPVAPERPVSSQPGTAAAAPPGFVNRVWRVAESSAAAPGQLYIFLSEGTLVIASDTGTTSLGRWSRTGDGLTLVEEGRAYPTDIVSLTADEFRIRSHNPGQPVDIRLVPADRDHRVD